MNDDSGVPTTRPPRQRRRLRQRPGAVSSSYMSVLAGMTVAAVAALLLSLAGGAAAAPANEPPKQGKPQVWDGGAWHEFDEEIHPDEPRPFPPVTDSWRRNDTTVHVSISSFRDHRCPKTLYNLFTKARHPERVHVGVVQQNNEGDMDCLIAYCAMMKKEKGLQPIVAEKSPARTGHVPALENCPYGEQISIMRVAAEEAKGPTYGRYLQSKLIGEGMEFCMQTDAHMDFLYDWDVILLDMWGLIDNEYAVLTTYVPRIEEMGLNVNERWEVPHICRAFFTPGDKMVRNEQAKAVMWLTRPKLTSTWAAGFAFNKCHADRRTPYDPHLPSLFDGEEFSKYARLWTRGYDTYTPHRSVVYHDYNHNANTAAASSWSRKMHELRRAQDRLRVLFGYDDAPVRRNTTEAHAFMGLWDLGTRRTLDQLIEFTGVDTRKKEITKSSCQRLVWVPFDREEEGLDDDQDPMLPASFDHAGYRARAQSQMLQQERQRRQRRRMAAAAGDGEDGEVYGVFSAKAHPALTTLLWLGIAFLIGLQARKKGGHGSHHHGRGRAHSCGGAAASTLLLASHAGAQRGAGGYHVVEEGDGEGHYVSAADV